MASPETGTPLDGMAALAAALERDLRLRPCASLAALLELTEAGFLLRPPRLTAAAHYEIQPALLIYDPLLGTVGLVEEIPAGLAAEALENEVERRIDRAANLRQLLLLRAEEASPPVLNLRVELVLAVPAAYMLDPDDTIGETLRQIARDTTYLRAIGVNVLPCEPGGSFARGMLRRAFVWLLRETAEWFRFLAGRNQHAPGALLARGKPWSLTLKHYRLSGTRIFSFRENCRLHLLHGHNGSGKSTFSEALELLLARSIQRLDEAGEKDYSRVVRHRPAAAVENPAAAAPAQVTLACDPLERTVTVLQQLAFTPPADTAAPLQVTSFRLDQRFMDNLIRSTESERAGLFLRAFFPQDNHLFTNLVLLQSAAAEAFARLPKRFQEGAPADADKRTTHVTAMLQWSQVSTGAPAWPRGVLDTMDAALPLPAAKIRVLASAGPRLRSLLEGWGSDPLHVVNAEHALEELDKALDDMRPLLPEIVRSLEIAGRVVDEFKNWQAMGQVDRGRHFEPVLNEWLELEALSDLAAKYYDVIATLHKVQASRWQLPPQYAGSLPDAPLTPEQVERARQVRDRLRDDRSAAKSKVQAWTRPAATASASPEAGGAKPRQSLTTEEMAALNAVDPWLPSLKLAATQPKFGDNFREALQTDQPRTANEVHIGTPGGLQKAADEIAALRAACAELQAAQTGSTAAGERLTQVLDAWKAFDALARAQQAVTTALSTQVFGADSQLSAAVNELLTLFNSAPWAYPDIRLQGEIGQSRQTLGLTTAGDARAELTFNTAELNSLALALFLLCAPGVENPFRLLVLDDPLQNMDEMTVTSVARGLAQLVRIYPEDWQIAALFHGEENTTRIRNEAECAVYHLPWLSPSATQNGSAEFKADLSTIGRELQKLDRKFLTDAER